MHFLSILKILFLFLLDAFIKTPSIQCMFMHVGEKTREEEEEEKQPDEKKIQQFCSPMKKKNEE